MKPITQRDTLILAALRVIHADHYQSDEDPNADAESEYADDRLAEAARAYTDALDHRPDATPEALGECAGSAAAGPREKFIKALQDLARFLADRPGVPIPDYPDLTVYPPHGTDAQERAYVDAVAAALGVESTVDATGTHYQAARVFGPLTYKILTIAAREMAEHSERVRLGAEAFEARRAAETAGAAG